MAQPSPVLIAHLAERFRALGDETRIRLLLALRAGPQAVGALADALALPQATVSKHLAILRRAALVVGDRDGASVRYRVREPDLDALCDLMCRSITRHLHEAAAAVPAAATTPRPTKGTRR